MKELMELAFKTGKQSVWNLYNDENPIDFNKWYNSDEVQQQVEKNNIPNVIDKFYTKEQIYLTIDFGTELGQTTGFFEGEDSWIEETTDKFIETLK